MLSRYATGSGIQIKRVGADPVEGDTESCSGLFPQGASQAGMAVKKPRAERGDTFSIFCGYQRILLGGSKRNLYAWSLCFALLFMSGKNKLIQSLLMIL